jgi:membrane protein implicated in regulation of membrane protease activity
MLINFAFINFVIAGIWESYKVWYTSNFSPSMSWFMVGLLLIGLELLVPLPTLLIAGAMGVGALCVAGILAVIGYVHISVQLLIWVTTSALFVWYTRRFTPKGTWNIKDAEFGVTLTEILPNQMGRVKYEGNSWKARCDDPKTEIGANERVYVLRRQGTMLIVMPEEWFREHR